MAKYKIVALPKRAEYMELDLTPDEIQEYAKGGYIIEDISVPSLNKMQDGGEEDFYTVSGSDGVYRKVGNKWEVDWNRSGNFQPLSKGDVKARTEVLNKNAKPLYDQTYNDLYRTKQSEYTALPKPKPAPVKKPTAQDKAAQEQFDKNFQVTGKSKKEVVEDKIQKGIDEYVNYHNEKYDEPLTQEEYDAAYQDIYNRAYTNAGVYKPNMSGPVANPYGTTELRKNLISLDPGKAPKNLTLGDYVDKGWDIVTNPLDYASYALKPKGTVTIPWNMTNYENRLEAAGLEDPVTANNNVNKAIDFASYFIGPGMVAQGLKMVPGTVNSIGRAFENPSWENTGNAVWDAGMTALSIAPGFGLAKNLGKPAATIEDLKAIEALRGNTTTTPFQSYYLQGNRALGASEAVIPQSQALRRFIDPQKPQLPGGKQIMSESTKSRLTNPAVDSYFPVRYGDEPYAAAGNEMYHVDPEDFTVWNEVTKQWEINPNWKQEATNEFNWIWDDALSKRLKPFNPGKSENVGPWEFSQFSPGWEALQEAKGYLAGPQKIPKKSDYLTDGEFQNMLIQEMEYNILDDERKIQEAILGRKISDAEFAEMNPGVVRPDFTQKMLTEEQRKIVNDLLNDNPSVKSNPLLRENLQKLLDQNIGDAHATSKSNRRIFRSGDLPMSPNAVGETSTAKPSFRPPRGTAQQNALNDLENLRKQTVTGQDEALLTFERLQEQKLKDLKTPEGRKRIQEFIDDNNIKGEYDEGNYMELKNDYEAQLPEIVKSGDENKINDIVEKVKEYYIKEGGLRVSRNAKNSGLESWDKLSAADIERAANPATFYDVVLKDNISKALAKIDPKNTSKYKNVTVDDYIKHIEETRYDDMSMSILEEEMNIKNINNELNQTADELSQLRREYREGKISQEQYREKAKVNHYVMLDLETQLKGAAMHLTNMQKFLNRENASANLLENLINIGNPYTTIGNLEPTVYHEFGHITEASLLPRGINSAIDRDMIDGIDLLDEAPEYLFQSLDPDKILSETAPYNLTRQGINKYKNPDGYFNDAKEYFLKGGTGDPSLEPSAFAVELRPALKRLGLIKNDFDKVTPEMLKELYQAYTSNPEFKFLDLRIFDIMDPTEKSFKTLSKNLNKIKGIAPYAIPIGLGVGAAGMQEQRLGGESKQVKLSKFIG